MESSLRPRDIQARIRAGETPEAVAHAAGTSVEKIAPFAAPVMAERAHVAQRAQLASVRRRASESGARTLGDAVTAHLRAHNVDPGGVEWDAWRREDGRWTLTALYDVAGRVGTATFSHDPRGNFVTVDDDDAHWLIGDVAPAAPSQAAADDLAAARQRRLSAVGDDPLAGDAGTDDRAGASGDALGDDAIEMVTAESANETTIEISDPSLGAEQSVEAYLDGTDQTDAAGSSSTEDDLPGREPEQPAADTRDEPRARPARKRGRASVPSWDEIMFGGPSERG